MSPCVKHVHLFSVTIADTGLEIHRKMDVDINSPSRKAQQGDILAFEQLVYRHDKKVLSIAARYVTSADDAKDIYQEVFLRVYRGLKKFRFKSEFSTWVHRITVNVCLTHRSPLDR